jgi:hypothetical protein
MTAFQDLIGFAECSPSINNIAIVTSLVAITVAGFNDAQPMLRRSTLSMVYVFELSAPTWLAIALSSDPGGYIANFLRIFELAMIFSPANFIFAYLLICQNGRLKTNLSVWLSLFGVIVNWCGITMLFCGLS